MSDTEKRPLAKIEPEKKALIEGEVVPPALAKMKEKKAGKGPVSESSSIEDPRRIIRHGLIVIILFFGVLGIWATFGKISGAVVAPGKVKIETERKTVQHLEGGIVESIFVREGDEVSEGQTLITLESIQVDASVELLRKQLVANMAAYVRYQAEKELQSSFTWPEELQELAKQAVSEDVLANEMKIFHARRDAVEGQVSLLKSQIAQIKAQISGLEEQLRAAQQVIATLEEELKAKQQLYNERYLERSQILELERMLANNRGSRGQLRQSIAEAKQRLDESRLRIEDLTNRFVEDATNNLGRLENEILQAREKIRPLENAKTRLNVVAPVTGRVVGLMVHSKGGVVRPGEPLMDIVPADNPLIVEVQIPVNKVADVFIGQFAQVQLDAFDVRTTPLIKAEVVHISADRMEERTPSGSMPYYLGYVQIDEQSLKDANVYLSPGMPATVFITTKQRTVLFYILEPLLKNWDLALRD